MTDHDQFFKHLFQEFFEDLLRIVAPELASRLRVDEPEFLESELFTGFPTGKRRYLDLVARVGTLEGEPELVLVHVEVERQARKAMGHRLLDYAIQLWLEHHRPVVPVVVYLRGGKADVHRQEVRIEVFGESFFSFTYLAFGLSRSRAEAYLVRPEPLAWGLAGLMRRGELSSARHKLACLKPISKAELSDKQRYLLVNCVETYVQLDGPAREEYRSLLAEEGDEEMATMEMTWAGRLREEGKRELLLEQLERRFGPLPQATVRRIRAISSSQELSRLAGRVLDAPSLEELGL